MPDDKRLLVDAVARMRPRDIAVLVRSYYRGWTTAHIAADLQLTEEDVKAELHRALRTLKAALDDNVSLS